MPILIIITALVFTVIFWEVSTIQAYGWPIDDKFWSSILELQSEKEAEVYRNHLDLGFAPRISSISNSIFCSYHLEGTGTVTRWSKCHKIIKKHFRKAYKIHHLWKT